MDLSHGFEAYKLSLSDEGKRQLQKAATSTRKVERELGPLRFVYNASDGGVMQTLFEWKARKHAPLPGWARNALETLRRTRSERFSGFLSALYAGEQLIAAHFGMRSRTVWHLWFPAYNPQFRQYGPGILLMLKMAEHSAAVGINTMDLGKGTEEVQAEIPECFRADCRGRRGTGFVRDRPQNAASRFRGFCQENPRPPEARSSPQETVPHRPWFKRRGGNLTRKSKRGEAASRDRIMTGQNY